MSEIRNEVERIRRVSDQLCTAHAALRDKYARRNLAFDVIILLCSAWLTAVAFVDPKFSPWLTPFGLDPQLWTGVFGVAIFGLTLVQSRTDWRGRSESHDRSFASYVEVKREAGYLLAANGDVLEKEFQRLAARYDMASDTSIGIPENEFLVLKKKHKLKIEVSRLLDEKPSSSIWLTKFKMFIRDNKP